MDEIFLRRHDPNRDQHVIRGATNFCYCHRNAVTPFWPANSRICFIQVEAQFSWQGITASRMKHKETVCALPTKYATEVQDHLILWMADSERQKIRQLLTMEKLGDSIPPSCFTKCDNCWVERCPLTVHFYANYLTTAPLWLTDDSGLSWWDEHQQVGRNGWRDHGRGYSHCSRH